MNQAVGFSMFATLAQMISIFFLVLFLFTFILLIYFLIVAIKYMKTKTRVDQEILQSIKDLSKINGKTS